MKRTDSPSELAAMIAGLPGLPPAAPARHGEGSTIRAVFDYTPAESAWCLRWVGEGRGHQLCCRKPGHTGGCIPLPRYPRSDVTDENPAYEAATA